MSTQLKAGIRTSEFALVVIIAVLTQINVLQVGNDRQKGWITAALGIAYALSRGLAKAFPPKDQTATVPDPTGALTGSDVDELPTIPPHPGNVPPDQGDAGKP